MTVQILIGDVLARLAELPDESVHTVITSPPYWGLRDYGVAGQLGTEPSLGEHIDALVSVFREVRRVLRSDGTLWLNYGDCFANDGKWGGTTGGKHAAGLHGKTGVGRRRLSTGLKPKDLAMVANRVAIALQDDGWFVRQEIVWHKTNPMPESAKDRPTTAHEKIWLLTKRPRYFYDAFAVQEAATYPNGPNAPDKIKSPHGQGFSRRARSRGVPPRHAQYESSDQSGLDQVGRGTGRNLRSVWSIATQPFPGAHFATFPTKLVETCLKAGTSERGVCSSCGAPWRRIVEKRFIPQPDVSSAKGIRSNMDESSSWRGSPRGSTVSVTLGWEPTCTCKDNTPMPAAVLDPFGGSGTVGLVADRMRRNAILIELSNQYAEMARSRIQGAAPLLSNVGVCSSDPATAGGHVGK